ncbi:MAG: carboxypeptidase regulatory-like domain-containing protein [Candidatus Sulfotelmatobacter sp.]
MKLPCAESSERKLRFGLRAIGSWGWLAFLLAGLMSLPMAPALGQDSTPQQQGQVEGVVRDSAGKPVAGASVSLQGEDQSKAETKTDAGGAFIFLAVRAGRYSVKIEKTGSRDAIESSINLLPAEKKHCDLVFRGAGESSAPSASFPSSSASSAIELDDRPNFIVAGVTDSTGSGGHGSETRMRTGEVLAKETLNLESGESKGASSSSQLAAAGSAGLEAHASEGALRTALLQSPRSFDANHQLGEFYFQSEKCREAIPLLQTAYQVNPGDHANAFELALAFKACGELTQAREQVNRMLAREKGPSKQDEADLRRVLGDLDEKLEYPLEAEREYERAAGLDASEQNYFAWGAELLLHRAVAPALEVFGRGVRLHPDSARMLAGLGAALYTSGSVEEAAQRLCAASDLSPSDSAPYIFLGEMQEATTTPLPCVEDKLARFARDQPENAFANYYYALALWKRERGSQNPDALRQVETLLLKSLALDPKLDLADLQLGNFYFARGAFQEAVTAYQKAAALNPGGSQAHYRLGLTYKRIGEDAKAQREFEEYKQLEKTEAAALERQRRELRQFFFVLRSGALKGEPTSHAAPDPLPTSVSK